jgi:uncharacterized Zn ribbon protein
MEFHDEREHDDRNDTPLWRVDECKIHARKFWYSDSTDRGCPDCVYEANEAHRTEAAQQRKGAA